MVDVEDPGGPRRPPAAGGQPPSDGERDDVVGDSGCGRTRRRTRCARSPACSWRAGAVGLTVATVGEAEVFVADGASSVFIAYPLWATPAMGRRLAALAERAHVAVGVDSPEGAANLARHLGPAVSRVEAWVEVDSGHHRSGGPRGLARGRVVRHAPTPPGTGLRLTGVFTFPGHGYGPARARGAARDEGEALSTAAAHLRRAGHDIQHRSGGSSPSVAFSSPDHVTEVRPGVYALGDAQQLELERCGWDDLALTVAATVVSRREHERVLVLNAGSKVLGSDRPAWTTGFGRVLGVPEARITALSEHHGTVRWPDDVPLPALGEQVRVVPTTCA